MSQTSHMTLKEIRDALVLYRLPPAPPNLAEGGVEAAAWAAAAARLEQARRARSIVPAVLGVTEALGPHADKLDRDGAVLLAGASFMIAARGFGGKADEAVATHKAALNRLESFP